MPNVHSTVTELPRSCRSAADRAAQELAREDVYAALSGDDCRRLTALEQELSAEIGESIALVAYRLD